MSTPPGLRLASWCLWLAMPLMLVQTALLSQVSLWKLPLKSVEVWVGVVALICIPLSLAIRQGRRWALSLCKMFALFWSAVSVVIFFKEPTFWLGFYTAFLGLYWVSVLFWIEKELGRSYFDPDTRWYQGQPVSIPSMTCRRLGFPEKLNVSTIDETGFFAFYPKGVSTFKSRTKKTRKKHEHLVLNFRDLVVRARTSVVLTKDEGRGVGFRFLRHTPDQNKRIMDFIESLRGGGYV